MNINDDIVGIEPAAEVWRPGSRDSFFGDMIFRWSTTSGGTISGQASSVYHLEGSNLIKPQARVISFELDTDDVSFTQREKIDLYDHEQWRCDASLQHYAGHAGMPTQGLWRLTPD